jgi:hypothetical protein
MRALGRASSQQTIRRGTLKSEKDLIKKATTFSLTQTRKIPFFDHVLRLDSLDDSGAVRKRKTETEDETINPGKCWCLVV